MVQSSSSAAETPVSKLRKSSRLRARSPLRSARGSCRSHSASSADLFWWLTKLGLLEKSVDSRLGRRAQGRETLIGSSTRELRNRHGVTLKPRATGASGRAVTFADGTKLDVDAVIWATGYRPDHSWIELPIFNPDGKVRHRRGVTDVPGLYFLGLPWQYSRGSALLGFVKDDARYIADRIEAARTTAAKEYEPPDHPTESTTGVS